MSDEPAKILLGDTAISATERSTGSDRRGLFRRKKKPGRPPLVHCENCGSLLSGPYCSQCGQPAIDYRRSFRHVIVDVLDSFLNWDSKFLASVFYLLTRPWKLTNEFLAGHRVRYLNPLRLYLLVSVVFFFVANYGERRTEKDSNPIIFDAGDEKAPAHEPAPGATPPIDRPEDTDDDEDSSGLMFGMDKNRTPTIFEAWLQQRVEEKIGRHGSKGKFFLHSLMENLPYMMLGCIPVFAFILKALYFFRRILYIDHLIYALHIHSFAYLVSLVITGIAIGLNQVARGLTPLVLFVLITTAIVQVFLSIRRVYRQGWIMTVFKFFLGAVAYFVVILLALGATTFVTIALP
jgi:hypothetical protein